MENVMLFRKMIVHFIPILLLFLVSIAKSENGNSDRRIMYLEQIMPLLPPDRPDRCCVSPIDSTWQDWVKRTGELPPDFEAMPSLPFLPDPLILDEGGKNIPITTKEQWKEKCEWIKKKVQHWITGTFPPAPDNLEAEILSEKKDGRVTLRLVELRFGPEHKAILTVELMIPPGEGPLPVFMTQWNHRGWALIAVRRGYVGCIYAGADTKDDTEAYADIWQPQYDFTRLMRRGWGAHRVIDYLYTLGFVDREKIALTGHSRNGKQSLMAAAFDERITAVIPSSGGTGAEIPFRYTSDKFDDQTIAEITAEFPQWLHPRLRFFYGREHKLPVDQNLLMALVAPRGLMLSSALNEGQGNPWGIEQAYYSARKVYKFWGAPDKIAIRLRHGRHGTAARDIEAYIDFFDYVFGRNVIQPPRTLYYNYTFEKWLNLSGENINPLDYPKKNLNDLLLNSRGKKITSLEQWESKKRDICKRIQRILGEEPAGATNRGPGTYFNRRKLDDYLRDVILRPEVPDDIGHMVVGPYHSFGDYLYGNLYFPLTEKCEIPTQKKMPVVIFLHEYDFTTGYGRRIMPFFEKLINRSFAIFAFDMIGFGSRIEEGTLFYQRYPHWSKMGKMVADVKGAVQALQNMDFIDAKNIYTVGYSLGSTVGLYSAALDEHIAGMIAICGFTPMRLATQDKDIEGNRAYSHLHGLLPRLGFFLGDESRIPIDFHEIIACIAPRPLFVIAPKWNRDALSDDVLYCVQQVRNVYRLYNKDDALLFNSPDEFNRFTPEMQSKVIEWLESNTR